MKRLLRELIINFSPCKRDKLDDQCHLYKKQKLQTMQTSA
jgi:hypothetical protein